MRYFLVILLIFILNPYTINLKHTNELYYIYKYYEREVFNQKQIYNYVFKYARKYNNYNDAEELTSYIIKFSRDYNLNPSNMVRQGWQESRLQSDCYSKATWHARGTFQITRHYDYLLKKVDDGKLWQYIKTYRIPNSRWYRFYYVNKYSAEMACMIMSSLIKYYDGDYELAIIDYLCGRNSKEYRFFKNHRLIFRDTPYYKWCMGIYELD